MDDFDDDVEELDVFKFKKKIKLVIIFFNKKVILKVVNIIKKEKVKVSFMFNVE